MKIYGLELIFTVVTIHLVQEFIILKLRFHIFLLMETACDESVRTVCRVRPLSDAETQRKDKDVLKIPEEGTAVWVS